MGHRRGVAQALIGVRPTPHLCGAPPLVALPTESQISSSPAFRQPLLFFRALDVRLVNEFSKDALVLLDLTGLKSEPVVAPPVVVLHDI